MNLTAIIIVAIVAGAITSIIKVLKDNSHSKGTEKRFQSHEQQVEERLQTMQARIETLEKIVTDEKYDLNREFSNLKD